MPVVKFILSSQLILSVLAECYGVGVAMHPLFFQLRSLLKKVWNAHCGPKHALKKKTHLTHRSLEVKSQLGCIIRQVNLIACTLSQNSWVLHEIHTVKPKQPKIWAGNTEVKINFIRGSLLSRTDFRAAEICIPFFQLRWVLDAWNVHAPHTHTHIHTHAHTRTHIHTHTHAHASRSVDTQSI